MNSTSPRLYAGVVGGLVLAAAGGFGLAKCTAAKPTAKATSAADTPKESEEKPSSGSLVMTPAAISSSDVAVETVSAGALGAEILAPATVAASPTGQAVLTARASGAIIRLSKRLGDPVRAGEVLAVVESREAAQFAADRSAAAAKATLAQKTLARERYLLDQRVSPRQDYEQAQAEAASAAAEVRRAQVAASVARVTADGRGVLVTSPISGRITAASASLGAFVQPETELFRVADPRQIQVEAAVPGPDAARIAPGDPATVVLADGRTLMASVRAITPSLNAETRAGTVVLSAPGGAGLQLGQLVQVRIRPKGSSSTAAIVVSDEAVQTVGGRDAVFVRTPQGFAARFVTLGRRSGGRVEIAAGLQSGAVIATRNAFLLKAELGKSSEAE